MGCFVPTLKARAGSVAISDLCLGSMPLLFLREG